MLLKKKKNTPQNKKASKKALESKIAVPCHRQCKYRRENALSDEAEVV